MFFGANLSLGGIFSVFFKNYVRLNVGECCLAMDGHDDGRSKRGVTNKKPTCLDDVVFQLSEEHWLLFLPG